MFWSSLLLGADNYLPQRTPLVYELDSELSSKLYELKIPDGHYNVAQMEEELARQAWLTHKATDKLTSGHAQTRVCHRWLSDRTVCTNRVS